MSGIVIDTETVRSSDTSAGNDFSFTFTNDSSIDESQFAVNSAFIIGFGDESRNIEWVPKLERLAQLTDVPSPDPDADSGRVLKVTFNDDNPVYAWQPDIDTNTDTTLITDEVQHMAVTGSRANTHIASGTSRIISMNINEAYVSKQVQRPYFMLRDFLGGTDFPIDTATSTTISFRNTLVANFFATLVSADPVGGFPVVVSTGTSDLDPVATITGRVGGVNSLDYVGTNLDQFNSMSMFYYRGSSLGDPIFSISLTGVEGDTVTGSVAVGLNAEQTLNSIRDQIVAAAIPAYSDYNFNLPDRDPSLLRIDTDATTDVAPVFSFTDSSANLFIVDAEDTPASTFTFTQPGTPVERMTFNALSGETVAALTSRIATALNNNPTFGAWDVEAVSDGLNFYGADRRIPVPGLWTSASQNTNPGNTSNTQGDIEYAATATEVVNGGSTIRGFGSGLNVSSNGIVSLGVDPFEPRTFIESTPPTTGVRAGDIWVNDSGAIVTGGTGVVRGRTFTPVAANGRVNSLRQARQNDTAGTLFAGFDIADFQAPAATPYGGTSTLRNAAYVVVSPDGYPSSTAFSLAGIRRRIAFPDTTAGVVLFDTVSVSGIANAVTQAERTAVNLRNPDFVARTIGIPLRDTYNSTFYQVSAEGVHESQPVSYTPAQFRVYARGRHVRNLTNNGWISDVTGYTQMDA